jgi:hypothetical protein
MGDGAKIDLSDLNMQDFDSKARSDLLAKLTSAFTQVQNFVVE